MHIYEQLRISVVFTSVVIEFHIPHSDLTLGEHNANAPGPTTRLPESVGRASEAADLRVLGKLLLNRTSRHPGTTDRILVRTTTENTSMHRRSGMKDLVAGDLVDAVVSEAFGGAVVVVFYQDRRTQNRNVLRVLSGFLQHLGPRRSFSSDLHQRPTSHST